MSSGRKAESRLAGSYRCLSDNGLFIRSEKSTDSKAVGSIPFDAVVTVSGGDGEWAQVSYDGQEGYSKLTFLANNGNCYRAEWHIRFKSKKFENPVTKLYKLTKSPDGIPQEEPAVWEDLPAIIGLDYEQFLRTVLIAQGSFANFLTAKEDERYELLEKLIGCEDLYIRIANEIKSKKLLDEPEGEPPRGIEG